MKNGHLVNTGKTNPKRTQSKPISEKAKMNVTSYITAGYENKSPNRAPKKRTQISKRQKPIQTPLLQRIMKKACFWVPKKRTQNEPNLSWRSRIKPNLSGRSLCRSRVAKVAGELAFLREVWYYGTLSIDERSEIDGKL